MSTRYSKYSTTAAARNKKKPYGRKKQLLEYATRYGTPASSNKKGKTGTKPRPKSGAKKVTAKTQRQTLQGIGERFAYDVIRTSKQVAAEAAAQIMSERPHSKLGRKFTDEVLRQATKTAADAAARVFKKNQHKKFS